MSSLLSIGGVALSFPPLAAGLRRPICGSANGVGAAQEAAIVRRAAEVADLSAGHSAPHPNSGCLIARGGDVVGQGFLYAQGTKCAELQAVEMAGGLARGATAYLNLEPDDCYGDHTPVSSLVQEALKSCLVVNAPLLYRTACHVPFSILKYAMTLDGKIAASSGHASWVSSKLSRGRVFELRGRSDAIVVGGNTVRRDDPQLTARHGGGHVPVRIVMSQTLDLPEEAKLWNVFDAYTIVATQRGARKDVQKKLAKKGVEVVEFDILNPKDVMEYCYDRGCLSILWECGGALAAPAISSGVIHKVCAFVAPKIIGGLNAPSPVGELRMVQMSQALNLIDVSYEQIGPDMLISGFLQPIPDLSPVIPQADETSALDPTVSPYDTKIISFYKTWDLYGALSNFSPHPVRMPDEDGTYFTWSSVEHYYQAHKFVGVESPLARDFIEQIKLAKSPEEAARLGRKLQREHPELVRPDWESVKIELMYRALKCKFSMHPHLKSMLCSTAGSVLVEASPHDLFWGGGREGEGLNYLGRLLMQLRSEILKENSKLRANSS
ncbi:riboflavin biosynthesis protein PYRR, chloroplastic isoform X4 [Elaeis guineensis]|uniref:riboflavin biosynthesis protein PYRR, chloroplastic isoform X4 n=1 Tax=Elaeis guineensis var. tenera TaxID=51953 RepID=UPI000579FAE8